MPPNILAQMSERAKDCTHSELTNGRICMGCGITIDRNGGLPDWLKELAAQCPPEDIAALEERLKPNTQSDNDRTYRAKQATKGIVRKSVLVPENRVDELHALLKQWRSEVA
jgi:hypothetical protein